MYDSISKICVVCGQLKPLTEYYRRAGSHLTMSWCKVCHIERGKKQNRVAKHIPAAPAERLVLDKLIKQGIYATSGKLTPFPYVDIVAWGCVRVEVKSATLRSNHGYAMRYQFAFTAHQQIYGFQADIVILVCLNGDKAEDTYHVFPVDFPIFYFKGVLKSGVGYSPQRKKKERTKIRPSLSKQIMDDHQDAWHLIEEKRLEISQRLRSGEVWPG